MPMCAQGRGWPLLLLSSLLSTSLGLVRDTSGHVMLAVRKVTIMVDRRAVPEPTRIVRWRGPGPGTDQDCSDSSQTVPELLTKFGSDGCELVALQEHCEGGCPGVSIGDHRLSLHSGGVADCRWPSAVLAAVMQQSRAGEPLPCQGCRRRLVVSGS